MSMYVVCMYIYIYMYIFIYIISPNMEKQQLITYSEFHAQTFYASF